MARLTVGQVVLRPAALRIAVARPVEEEQVCAPFQLCVEGMHLVAQVAACAMDEDDGRQVGIFAGRHEYAAHAKAADLDQFTGVRMLPFEGACLPCREDVAGERQGEGSGKERDQQRGQGLVRA